MPDTWLLSLDFGTVNTVAATRSLRSADVAARPPELVDFGSSNRMPSAVSCSDDGVLQVGDDINESGQLAFDRLEQAPKRRLGVEDTVILGRHAIPTTDVVAAVLRYAADTATRLYDGVAPSAVNLTHPAMWTATRTQALRVAAASAGLVTPRLVEEPVAAARALEFRGALPDLADGDTVIVYDFGGGTFDVTLVRMVGGELRVLDQPGGDDDLGGENLDDDLFFHVLERLPESDRGLVRGDGVDPMVSRRAGLRLRQGVRLAKERLRTQSIFTFELGGQFSEESWTLTRAELQEFALPRIEATFAEVDRTLKKNALSRSDVSALCLVGGSSSLTLVGRLATQVYDCRIIQHGDPKALVAYGAALLAPPLGDVQESDAQSTAPPDLDSDRHGPPRESSQREPQPEPEGGVMPSPEPQRVTIVEDEPSRTSSAPRAGAAASAPAEPEPAAKAQAPPSTASQESGERPFVVQSHASDMLFSLRACAAATSSHLPRQEVRIEELLVGDGSYVGLGQPLVRVSSDLWKDPYVLRSPATGLLKASLVSSARDLDVDVPAFRFEQPAGLAITNPRHDLAGETGVVLQVQGSERARSRISGVTVELARHRHMVWVGPLFYFPTPAGKQMMAVNLVSGGSALSSTTHWYAVKRGKRTAAYIVMPSHGTRPKVG